MQAKKLVRRVDGITITVMLSDAPATFRVDVSCDDLTWIRQDSKTIEDKEGIMVELSIPGLVGELI